MYPNITILLRHMAQDNEIRMRCPDTFEWPTELPLDQLEAEAAKLDEDEKQAFIWSERKVVERLITKYSIRALDDFFDTVFDGYLYDRFYLR